MILRAVALFALCGTLIAAPQFSQQRLDDTIAKWQRILRLDDFEIIAKFVPGDEIPMRWAESQTDMEFMTVQIHVLEPADYATRRPDWTDKQVEDDIVDSIVHELVHVRLKPLTGISRELIEAIEDPETHQAKSISEMKIEEAVVVRITKALLAVEKQ